jgi:hypothetical protein
MQIIIATNQKKTCLKYTLPPLWYSRNFSVENCGFSLSKIFWVICNLLMSQQTRLNRKVGKQCLLLNT